MHLKMGGQDDGEKLSWFFNFFAQWSYVTLIFAIFQAMPYLLSPPASPLCGVCIYVSEVISAHLAFQREPYTQPWLPLLGPWLTSLDSAITSASLPVVRKKKWGDGKSESINFHISKMCLIIPFVFSLPRPPEFVYEYGLWTTCVRATRRTVIYTDT